MTEDEVLERVQVILDEVIAARALSPQEFNREIKEVAQRIREQYGPKYAILATTFFALSTCRDSVAHRAQKLVIVLHGIRDQGEWMEMVKVRLQADNVVVQPIDFEDYDAVRFMTGWGISGIVDRVLAKIRHAKADHEGAELLVIAHSFGTFVVTEILNEAPDIRFSRAIFCGSVVPRTFRFDKVPHCPKIVNECGGRDIWPVVAQGFSLWNSYGAAGVWGIRAPGVEDRFHDSGHSDYLTPDFVDRYWKPYVHDNLCVPSPYQGIRRAAPRGVSLLSYGWRLIGIGLLLTAIVVACTVWLGWHALAVAAIPAIVWIGVLCWIANDIRRFCSKPEAAT